MIVEVWDDDVVLLIDRGVVRAGELVVSVTSWPEPEGEGKYDVIEEK